jgi:hypothetical protein
MTHPRDEDRELRARFDALREEDAASAPRFDVAWDHARSRGARRRSWQAGGAALVLAAAAAAMIVVLARRDDEPARVSMIAPGIPGDPEPLGFLLEPLPGDAWAIELDAQRSER